MANPTKNDVVLARNGVVLKVMSDDVTPVELTALNPKSFKKNVDVTSVETTGINDNGHYGEVGVKIKYTYTFSHDLLMSDDATPVIDPFLGRCIELAESFGQAAVGNFIFTCADGSTHTFAGTVKYDGIGGGESDLVTINFTVTSNGEVTIS